MNKALKEYHGQTVVYVLISDNGPAKVGISRYVDKRLSSLNKGSFVQAKVFSVYVVDNARQIERMAHERMAAYRLTGEWFDVPVTFANVIVADCIAHLRHGQPLSDIRIEDFSRHWVAASTEADGYLATKVYPISEWLLQ